MNSNISKASTGDSNINKKRVSSPKLSRLPLYNSNPNLHPGRPSSPSLIPIKGEPGRGLVFVKHYTALYSIVQHCTAWNEFEDWNLVLVEGHVLFHIFFFSFFLWQSCASFFCFCVSYTWTPSVSLTCSYGWLIWMWKSLMSVSVCNMVAGYQAVMCLHYGLNHSRRTLSFFLISMYYLFDDWQ